MRMPFVSTERCVISLIASLLLDSMGPRHSAIMAAGEQSVNVPALWNAVAVHRIGCHDVALEPHLRYREPVPLRSPSRPSHASSSAAKHGSSLTQSTELTHSPATAAAP